MAKKKGNYNLSYCQSAIAHISLARLAVKSAVQQKINKKKYNKLLFGVHC